MLFSGIEGKVSTQSIFIHFLLRARHFSGGGRKQRRRVKKCGTAEHAQASGLKKDASLLHTFSFAR